MNGSFKNGRVKNLVHAMIDSVRTNGLCGAHRDATTM